MTDRNPDSPLVVLGALGAHHGVRGGLKVRSHTRPVEQIFEYPVWKVGRPENPDWKTVKVSSFRKSGRHLVVQLQGYSEREATEELVGCQIAVDRSRLEILEDGEFYWMDLIGLRVINQQNVELGELTGMLETGANDIAVVTPGDRTERLLPWAPRVIRKVDLEAGIVTVDWDESF